MINVSFSIFTKVLLFLLKLIVENYYYQCNQFLIVVYKEKLYLRQ